MKKGLTILALAATLTGAIGAAQADTNTSSTKLKTVSPNVLDKFTASYYNLFNGASLSSPGSGLQPDKKTGALDATSPLSMNHNFVVGYKINPEVTLSAIADWDLSPVQGHAAQLNDPILRLSNSKFLSKGNFNMYADVRFLAPASDKSQQNNVYGTFQVKQVSTYEIPHSRFTVGAVTKGAYFAHGHAEGSTYRDMRFYLGPIAEYKISPKVAATVLYEAEALHNRGQGLTEMHDYYTDLEPGMSFDLTPNLNISPYLDIKTGNRISADTTQMGALLSWKLL